VVADWSVLRSSGRRALSEPGWIEPGDQTLAGARCRTDDGCVVSGNGARQLRGRVGGRVPGEPPVLAGVPECLYQHHHRRGHSPASAATDPPDDGRRSLMRIAFALIAL